MYAIESHLYSYSVTSEGVKMTFVCLDTMRYMLNVGHPHWGIRMMNTGWASWSVTCPPGFQFRSRLATPRYLFKDGHFKLEKDVQWDGRQLTKGFCYKAGYERKIPLRASMGVSSLVMN